MPRTRCVSNLMTFIADGVTYSWKISKALLIKSTGSIIRNFSTPIQKLITKKKKNSKLPKLPNLIGYFYYAFDCNCKFELS